MINSPCFRKNAKQCIVLTPPCGRQGQTGRVFQLRVGSCSGIEKIFQVGLGIGYLYQIPSKLGISGIEILIGHSPSISLISYIFLYLISYLINMVNQTYFWWTDICHYGPVWQKLAAFWGPRKISQYPKIPDYSENISGRVRVLLKIIGSGIGYPSDTVLVVAVVKFACLLNDLRVSVHHTGRCWSYQISRVGLTLKISKDGQATGRYDGVVSGCFAHSKVTLTSVRRG